MKLSFFEFLIGLGALLVVVWFVTTWIDLDDFNQQNPGVAMYMSGKIPAKPVLKEVKIVKIPPSVFNTLTKRSKKYVRFFTSNKKYVVCFYVRVSTDINWKKELKKALVENGLFEYYLKHVTTAMGRTITIGSAERDGKNPDAQYWVHSQCQNKICVIHPLKKQMAILDTQDPTKIAPFLEKYKEW
ncbi:MAG: hypothetical protein J5601_01515 [Elusimicrobiaceae bacterium]|nr:hypothetical protein [Elusimicrobiaceae bacterium]